jgi:hypothetical protein
MANHKPETAESAAQKVIKAVQPVVTFSGFDGLKDTQKPPTVKPLPAPLAKALGQS